MDICKLNGDYYFYKEPIGFGSFSIIYKGYSTKNKKLYAIKQITKIVDMKYFNNEVQLMKKLDHPNILKLYDVIHNNGKIYLILEYCNGGDLSNYIKSGSKEYNYRYFCQIFSGLEYLYKNNILHRDIKPQNILVDNDIIKISDFGFARSFEQNELITTFCGSPLYMAPEIIKNKEYNTKSDIWSLGVIIYELFAKEHPYYTNSKDVLWNNIKRGININFDLIIDDEIRYFLETLLVDNPDIRVDWNNLFNDFNKIEIYDLNQSVESSSSDIFLTYNDNFSYNNKTTNSLVVPNKHRPIAININQSVNINSDNSFTDNEDYRIFSRSAPTNLGNSYMENYIKNTRKNNHTENNMELIGNTPPVQNSSINSYLDKSVKTFKNILGW